MRLCVAHVYWMLLCVSAISSGLLFLIVASESIQANKFIGPDKNQGLAQEDNVSIVENIQDQFDVENQVKSNLEVPHHLKIKLKAQNSPEFLPSLSASFENLNHNEEPKSSEEIEILKETLSQQPNLSQGISANGSPIVLTLVDTSSTNLDLRPLNTGKSNITSDTTINDDDNEIVRLSELVGTNNATNINETYEPEVVVVRAEQKRIVRDEIVVVEEQQRQTPPRIEPENLPKTPTTAPELNDGAARAQLTGSVDDSAAILVDSLVLSSSSTGPSEKHEDMPSFNEWAQKRLVEEAEKKKTHPNASVQTANGAPSRGHGGMRMRSKNYASPDCGAKVVAATPDSSNARNVLVSSRDEYMLNACTNRVWFVVELCEAIQARRIELANFELFSSSPKDLTVYVSDLFPTRDWTFVGQFTARDERDIQSFVLEPRLFGKFIKVELQSHYGSEHFCPISLFRVYGTSEFEVLETETESDALNEARRIELAAGDDLIDYNGTEIADAEDVAYVDDEQPTTISSNPLFAVLRLIRKGAEILIRSADFRPTVNNITKIQESISGDVLQDTRLDDCGTPLYNIACRGCDDKRFGRVFQLISCKRHYLESLISLPFIKDTLAMSRLCESDSGSSNVLYVNEACVDETKKALRNRDSAKYYFRARFLSSVFTPDYIIALCNILAAREQRLFANTSHQEQLPIDHTPNKTRIEQTIVVPIGVSDSKKSDRKGSATSTNVATEVPTSNSQAKIVEPSLVNSKLDAPTESINLSESLVTQIKPTKTTAASEDAKKPSLAPNLESSMNQVSEDSSVHKLETLPTTESSVPVVTKRPSSQKSPDEAQESKQKEASSASTTSLPKLTPSSTDSSSKSSSEKIDSGTKTDTKLEELNAKQKMEPEKSKEKEEPVKFVSQEQLNFEGFDLKDLEVESTQSNGNKNDAASTTQQSTASTPQQKESVFQRLSNRIKTLERNMSLSGQYLEELSRRYKKQVEEMQRSLERALTAMNEESRKGEAREIKHLEEVAVLRVEISGLTKLLDDLIGERNSWWRIFSFSALAQHGLFVLVDVALVILILSLCRRVDDDADYVDEREESQAIRKVNRQGKTYEIVKQKCSQLAKKTKKRRPSEIASQVTGTYDQLMIDSTENGSKNSKKKKRKKDLAISRTESVKETSSNGSFTNLNVQLPSRSSSASDAISTLEKNRRTDVIANLESQRHSRPGSAPDNVIKYFSNSHQSQQLQQQSLINRRVQILSDKGVDDYSVNSTSESRNPEDLNNSSVSEDTFESGPSIYSSFRKKLSSPSFMKTALGARSKRMSLSGGSSKKSQSLESESPMKPLERQFDTKMDSLSELEATNGTTDDAARTTNGFMDESDESRSSCATPTSKKKRASSLKRMVKKIF